MPPSPLNLGTLRFLVEPSSNACSNLTSSRSAVLNDFSYIKLFQYGEFKFPDVAPTKHQLLTCGSGTSFQQMPPTHPQTSSRDYESSSGLGGTGLQGFGSLGGDFTHGRGFLGSSSDGSGSPTALDDSVFGPGSMMSAPPRAASCPQPSTRFNFSSRSFSPESDAGYGTSYGSSPFSSGGQRKSAEERDLAELLVRLTFLERLICIKNARF